MKNLRIGICGWGNIATGLYKTILENKDEIYCKSNLEIEIVAIANVKFPIKVNMP